MTQANYPEVVRKARKTKGLTQQQLADLADVALRTVQGLESGQTKRPQPANLRAILRVLDLDPEGEVVAEVSRSTFRPTTQVALDMLGAYLDSLPEEQAIEVIADLTRQIFAANRAQ